MANFFADLLTGGAASKNEQAKKAAKKTNKYNKKVYEFQFGDVDSDELGGEALRSYDFAVEGLEITKRNNERNLQFQEANLLQSYDYGMGIRAYEYNQRVRAYDESVSRAFEQTSFDTLAANAANVEQDRLLNEQLISLAFDETETLLNYGIASAGLGLKKRQAKAGAVTETQATRISSLKAQGAAQARGVSGRTAAKTVQGIIAETGARQGAIIDELLFNNQNTNVEYIALNNQLAIDQAALLTSKESALMSNIAERNKIQRQFLQSLINAENSIELLPEIAPPLPIPFALPRPEYQDVFKPAKPPEPQEVVAPQQNLFSAALGTIGSVAVGAVTGGISAGASVGGLTAAQGAFLGGAKGLFG